MQQVQLTFKQLAEAALKLGATPNAIRVWRQRGIPHRYQVKLMQHFNGALKIIDWSHRYNRAASNARRHLPGEVWRLILETLKRRPDNIEKH
jgi:hypothetical protein